MEFNFIPRRRSLPFKILAGVVLMSSTITLIITVFSLSMDYHSGVSRIELDLRQVECLYLTTIIRSLQDLNTENLSLNLNDILNFSDIRHLLITNQGQTLMEVGDIVLGNSRKISLPITARYQKSNFPQVIWKLHLAYKGSTLASVERSCSYF